MDILDVSILILVCVAGVMSTILFVSLLKLQMNNQKEYIVRILSKYVRINAFKLWVWLAVFIIIGIILNSTLVWRSHGIYASRVFNGWHHILILVLGPSVPSSAINASEISSKHFGNGIQLRLAGMLVSLLLYGIVQYIQAKRIIRANIKLTGNIISYLGFFPIFVGTLQLEGNNKIKSLYSWLIPAILLMIIFFSLFISITS